MFAGIYRDFAGKSECGDFKFTGIACIPAIPVIFEVNQKKVWTFYIYTLLRFFKFPYNFCGDFRRTCNPRDNYMHFTGYVLRHGDPPHFLWGKNLQCSVVMRLVPSIKKKGCNEVEQDIHNCFLLFFCPLVFPSRYLDVLGLSTVSLRRCKYSKNN